MNLGWIPFDERTPEMHAAHELALADMPKFRISGASGASDVKKVVLGDTWKHPLVQDALGFAFPRFHQLTGSCVGAGGGNALFTLAATEVILKGDREQIILPFWPFNYGKSRERAGMNRAGEGSVGSTFADSVKGDGVLDARFQGLPKFTNNDGLILTESLEYQWSVGRNAPQAVSQEAAKHLVKTVAQCPTADDVRQAILNLYPCTDACSGFVQHASVRGSGDDAVLMGDIDSWGGHQTSIQGWWEHPQFGELFLYQNNWPANSYPADPAGGPPCSLWITKQRMDWICQQGEVYAFSQYDGYPAQEVDKVLFKIIGS